MRKQYVSTVGETVILSSVVAKCTNATPPEYILNKGKNRKTS
jgi:hypothetical protein